MGLTELEYNHLYDYAAFCRYQTSSSKNQRRIQAYILSSYSLSHERTCGMER